MKTESQEVLKKYTGIFAISSKGIIWYEVYKKGGIDSNGMVDFITNAIEGYFNVLKSRLQKEKGLTYDELVKNVKDVLDEIPIHIL